MAQPRCKMIARRSHSKKRCKALLRGLLYRPGVPHTIEYFYWGHRFYLLWLKLGTVLPPLAWNAGLLFMSSWTPKPLEGLSYRLLDSRCLPPQLLENFSSYDPGSLKTSLISFLRWVWFYSKELERSIVGEFLWSWILGDATKFGGDNYCCQTATGKPVFSTVMQSMSGHVILPREGGKKFFNAAR